MADANHPSAEMPRTPAEIHEIKDTDIQHHEDSSDITRIDTHRQVPHQDSNAFDTDELPKGYFLSTKFLGTFFGVGMNLMASTVSIAYI